MSARSTNLGRSLRVGLRGDLTLAERPEGELAVTSALGSITLKQVTPGLRAAFHTLVAGTATVDELGDQLLAVDGDQALQRLYYHLEQFRVRGMLQHTAVADGAPLATISGIGAGYRFEPRAVDLEQPYLLSRFAYCRREQGRLVLESPLGHAQIILHGWRGAGLLSLLVEPRSVRALAAELPGVTETVVADCFQLLLNLGALTTGLAGAGSAEDEDPILAQWNFHDLLFHSRSRFGRHASPFGATFRHVHRIAPLPAVKPLPAGEPIALHRPDLAHLQRSDPALARVMETRRSVYEYGRQPISLKQLGEFLYRVARVRSRGDFEVLGPDGQVQETMQVSSRPYPAGGKCYELEFYLTVNQCDGLPGGLYHYDPLEHRLTRLRERDAHVEALLRYASIAAPRGKPQVLITLAARFQRMSWKYDSIAYATTLKHVGVVYQSMYLAATAMGLAPCALGSGDADLFAAAAKTQYTVETSVGDFMLGSLPGETG